MSLCTTFSLETQEVCFQCNLCVAPPDDEQEKLFKQFYDGSHHSGFQVLLALKLGTRFCEAGHPDAQVRECGDLVDVESKEISPWTEMLQTPGADFSLHV